MKITMVKKDMQTKERQTKELEGDENTLVSMMSSVLESETYKNVERSLKEIMFFEIDASTSQQEAESFHNKLLEQIVKNDKIETGISAHFIQQGKDVLSFRKKNNGYYSTNYYRQNREEQEFADLELYEAKTFNKIPLPEKDVPGNFKKRMSRYNPIGI